MTEPTELERTSAALVACMVRERGLIGVAQFLRELADVLDRVKSLAGAPHEKQRRETEEEGCAAAGHQIVHSRRQ